MNRYRTFSYIVLLIVAVSVGSLLSGCSDEETDILPNISLSITSLNFGAVTIGEFVIQTATINNLQNGDMVIERVTSTNTGFRVGGYYANGELVALALPFTIEEDAARTLYIGFYPTEAREYTGKLVIESVDDNDRAQTDLVNLTGLGLAEKGDD
jgi:hypothetical protein